MSEPKVTLHDVLTAAAQPGIFRIPSRASAAAVARAAEAAGWRVYRIAGRRIADKPTFMAESAASLHFPRYFGHNWDAFEESLNDLADAAEQPTLVLFDRAGRFATAEPEEFAVALNILAAAVEARRATHAPLVVVLQGASRAADVPVMRKDEGRRTKDEG